MTDAKMLQNLLAVYETVVTIDRDRFGVTFKLKEVIAELRRRIALESDRT